METRARQSVLEPHISQSLVDHPHPYLKDSYKLCQQTGVIYCSGTVCPESDYEEDYFEQEYSKQYGLSYIEDEIHLRNLARRRLRLMASYLRPRCDLLEIGCAAGFFLDEARKAGYSIQGIEVSQYASYYACNALGLDVSKASFLSYHLAQNSFDAICSFYVIEHFPQQKSVFLKISNSLRPGGILCFALPSLNGPLFCRNLREWCSSHPSDHFADYSSQSLKKTLARYGLALVKVWPASYHPERLGKIWQKQLMSTLYRSYAKMFCYGDTMEGIAVKL